jgi:hypothetical protein
VTKCTGAILATGNYALLEGAYFDSTAAAGALAVVRVGG